jgi:hypothetical protein
VQRDGSGDFWSNTVGLDGNLNFSTGTGTSAGAITVGGVPILTGSGAGGSAFFSADTVNDMASVTANAEFGTVVSPTAVTCLMPAGIYGQSPQSAGACNSYCMNLGGSGGQVSYAPGSGCTGDPTCNYVSDFGHCTVSSIPNNNECDSCPATFTCTCNKGPGVVLNGAVTASGSLQVNGYTQLGLTSGAPPATDCSTATYGRMKVDPSTNLLWVCVSAGWVSK